MLTVGNERVGRVEWWEDNTEAENHWRKHCRQKEWQVHRLDPLGELVEGLGFKGQGSGDDVRGGSCKTHGPQRATEISPMRMRHK